MKKLSCQRCVCVSVEMYMYPLVRVCVSLVGLEGSITAFRASHNAGPFETRGSRKLLILLPLNANITHTLEDEDTNIHFHDNLPDTEIDRAGVRGRVYKHSVYTVLDKDRQVGGIHLQSPSQTLSQSEMHHTGTTMWSNCESTVLMCL